MSPSPFRDERIGDKSNRHFELLLDIFLPELSEGTETVTSPFVGMQVFKVASEEIEGASLTPCAKGRR
jgi:hypothetical protein